MIQSHRIKVLAPYLLEEDDSILGHLELGEDGVVGGDAERNIIDGLRSLQESRGSLRLGVLQDRETLSLDAIVHEP